MYDADDILKSKTFKMKTKNCKNMMQFAECVVPHLNCICIWSIGNTVNWECRYNDGMEYSKQYFPCLAIRCFLHLERACVCWTVAQLVEGDQTRGTFGHRSNHSRAGPVSGSRLCKEERNYNIREDVI